jgi:hypothetical protein
MEDDNARRPTPYPPNRDGDPVLDEQDPSLGPSPGTSATTRTSREHGDRARRLGHRAQPGRLDRRALQWQLYPVLRADTGAAIGSRTNIVLVAIIASVLLLITSVVTWIYWP